jgi:hypothetical protein
VQRFGRAARGPGLRGFAILLAPPVTNDKYNKRPGILEFVKAMTERKEKKCRWEVVDQYLGNTFRTRLNCCDVCLGGPSRRKANLPAPAGPVVTIPRGKSTDREQEVGRKKLLKWRKMAYDQWIEGEEPMADFEFCFLPDRPLIKLCQKLFAATTPDMVQAIADNCDWVPMKSEHRAEIAQVIMEALSEANGSLDDQHASGSQRATSVADQKEDGSDGLGAGDDIKRISDAESVLALDASVIDRPPCNNQPSPVI